VAVWGTDGVNQEVEDICCVGVLIQFVLSYLLVFHICYNSVVMCQKVTRIS
jgi:hypothetical protein